MAIFNSYVGLPDDGSHQQYDIGTIQKDKKTHTHKKKNSNSDTGNRTDIVIAWVISIYFLSTNRGG